MTVAIATQMKLAGGWAVLECQHIRHLLVPFAPELPLDQGYSGDSAPRRDLIDKAAAAALFISELLVSWLGAVNLYKP